MARPFLTRLVAVAAMALGLLPWRAVPARADMLQPDEPETPPAPARAPLTLTADKSKIDLKEHHLEVRPSNALVKVTVKVFGDSGAVLADDTQTVSHPAGTPYVVRWSPSSDEGVAEIDVCGYDAGGSTYTITVTPWSVSIPHEEVTFKTGSAHIEDTEAPKLDASLSKVTEALARHPDLHGTLFIAGHTDTVGDPASNLRLSRQRALAIATWFRQHGLHSAIAYEGFGASALLVATANQVDEPRNRRVDYVLSVDPPSFTTRGGFRPSWSRVP
jgi:outer membrane protein OmpA-like peptidoglycan-associated protein